ncbi:MAG: hypothetical protein ABI970_22095 [Chloroflexota bacterium]
MKGMKKLLLPVLAGVLALALVIPAAAQDATATPDSGTTGTTAAEATASMGMGTLSCDSSTILLAGLAERYFGYMPTDVTLSNYVYGQYSPLFDMSGITSPSMEATADMSMEATADVSANPTMAPSTVMLNPAVISGEDPSCTTLRTSLESFFSAQLQSGTGAWDSKMMGTGASG